MAADSNTGALDALFAKPVFAALGEERVAMFRQFALEIEGKCAAEIVARYVKLNAKISKIKPLLQSEKEAISEAIKESLSDDDRRKFNLVLKMI